MRLPPRAVCAATSSSSVDLPTPGSPASRTTAPGTRPPPSTRSSSATPVARAAAASSIGTWPIGTAGAVTGPAAPCVRGAAAPASATRAPGLALAAAPDPLGGLPAALGAAVRRAGALAWRSSTHGRDARWARRQTGADAAARGDARATVDAIRSGSDDGADVGTIEPLQRGGLDAGSAPTGGDAGHRRGRAGVSRQTVSNALNSPELLRPDTLERVQAAIDRLGYTPNRAARNLRTRASHLVGLRARARPSRARRAG